MAGSWDAWGGEGESAVRSSDSRCWTMTSIAAGRFGACAGAVVGSAMAIAVGAIRAADVADADVADADVVLEARVKLQADRKKNKLTQMLARVTRECFLKAIPVAIPDIGCSMAADPAS